LHKKSDDLPLPSGTAIEQPEGPAQEMEMKYSKQLAAWAMRIPMEQSAKAEGAAEFLGILRWIGHLEHVECRNNMKQRHMFRSILPN